MHKAGQICRAALNKIVQRKRLRESTQSHLPPKDAINSIFLTMEKICRIMCLARPKHKLMSFEWVIGAFSSGLTKHGCKMYKKWPGESQSDGSAQVKPFCRWSMGWWGRRKGEKPSLELGPAIPSGICVSWCLAESSLVVAAAAVGGSIRVSLCVKKNETELFLILKLCCCWHYIKNKKYIFLV